MDACSIHGIEITWNVREIREVAVPVFSMCFLFPFLIV